MIYIYSGKNDITTDLVIEWLLDNEVVFSRINDFDFTKMNFSVSNFDVFSDATKIWQRRGRARFLPQIFFSEYSNREPFLNYISKEEFIAIEFVENQLKERLKENYIGSFIKEISNNKLVNLKVAKECGFSIPKTIVTNEKKVLLDFYEKNKPLITKDLRAPVNFKTKDKSYTAKGTLLIDYLMLEPIEDFFAPVLLQEYIPKKYEIRIFVLGSKIYSMAIFSQNDEKTQTDYRNYNTEKPNRNIPVLLPKKIEESVRMFMKKSNLNTGSIDLIVTNDNNYYFLEVNPMGQFHWLSQNCNYYIEKDIAQILMNENK